MKTKLLPILLLVLLACLPGSADQRTKTLRPEVKTINYLSKQPGRPPMPWPPPGVSAEVIDATSCLLNDANYVYPTKNQP